MSHSAAGAELMLTAVSLGHKLPQELICFIIIIIIVFYIIKLLQFLQKEMWKSKLQTVSNI